MELAEAAGADDVAPAKKRKKRRTASGRLDRHAASLYGSGSEPCDVRACFFLYLAACEDPPVHDTSTA